MLKLVTEGQTSNILSSMVEGTNEKSLTILLKVSKMQKVLRKFKKAEEIRENTVQAFVKPK